MLPLLIGAMLLVNITLAQSGWTQKKGNYYIKTFFTYGASDEYFTLSGDELETSKFTQVAYGFYGEYGLTDKLTLISHGPMLKQQYFETTEKITGIGDWPIGAKYQVLGGNIPVAVGVIVDLPIAKADNYAQNKMNNFERINLPTGDGEWNYRLTLAGSHAFHAAPVYISVYSTYNFRTEYNDVSFSDQFIAGAEVGVSLFNKGWLIASLQVQNSLGDAEVVDFVRGEGTEFTAFQLNAIYMLTKKWGLSASVFTYQDWLTDRANLYSANVFSFGVSYELKE